MFNELMQNLAKSLGESLDDIIMLFLVLMAAIWFICYDLRLLNIRKSLNFLNRKISGLNGYGSGNIRKINEFFEVITNRGIKNAWTACYYDSINLLNKEKTFDIKDYFNVNSIITIPARRKRTESIPGILSVAGLAGTFLGILSGIYRLDPALGINTKDGLTDFLNIITSSLGIFITALLLSILFQLLDRQLYHRAVSELNLFIENASRKIPMANDTGSLEMLVREQISSREALANMAVSISTQLGSFIGSELIPSIHKAFDEAIKNQVAPSLKSMSDMLYQLSEAAYNSQRKGMQIMVDSFINRLMTTMGLELEKLGSGFKSSIESNSKVIESIDHLIEKLSGNSELQKEVNTQTVMVLETIGCYQRQASEMISSFSVSIEGMNSFNEAVRGVLQSDSQLVGELDGQRQALRNESSEYFSKMDEQIGKLLEDMNVQLNAVFSRFNDITSMAFERLDQSLNTTVEGMSSNIKALADNMDDQVRDISIYARSLSEEIGELNARLENSVREFGSQMDEGVSKVIKDFDGGLSEICGRLGTAISNLKDAVEDLPSVIEAMKRYKEDNQGMVG